MVINHLLTGMILQVPIQSPGFEKKTGENGTLQETIKNIPPNVKADMIIDSEVPTGEGISSFPGGYVFTMWYFWYLVDLSVWSEVSEELMCLH